MTPGRWLLALYGVGMGLLVILAVAYDIWAVGTGHTTISEWCLAESQARPWLPALLTALVTLPLGMLLGHLWFPQYLPRKEKKT